MSCGNKTVSKLFQIVSTYTFLLSALLIPHASAPYNAVGTITPSYRYLAFIPSPILQSTLFSAPYAQYTIHSFCVPHHFHILHHLRPQVLKTILNKIVLSRVFPAH